MAPYQRYLETLSAETRIEIAKARLLKLVDRATSLIALNESNSIVVYSDTLSKQIPPSYAGHAFNLFQKTLHNHEIVQICALWDRPDDTLDQQSIPVVVALVDDDGVRKLLLDEVRGWHAGRGTRIYGTEGDPISDAKHLEVIEASNRSFAEQQAEKADAELTSSVQETHNLLKSPLLASVRNIRDKFLAHGLEATRAEKRGEVAPMKYGDEKTLLSATLRIVESLYLWVNGTHFDLDEVARIRRRYAQELWNNCRFTIPNYDRKPLV